MFYLSITMMLRAEYSMFSDPLFPLLFLYTTFTADLLQRILVYLFKLLQLWRISEPPKIFLAVDEYIEPYDPLMHLRSAAVRLKFLQKNTSWLLENINKLITNEALEKHREYLEYQYENLIRMKNQGKFENPY